MATEPVPRLTEEDYLALDRAANYKSEFVDGEMYAMSGGTLRHANLAFSIGAELWLQLKGRKCRVFNSDARVRASEGKAYFYPDISVVCGESKTHANSNDTLINPTVIVEVLSPSTSDYDHGKKFACYREIPTLQSYVLVHSDDILIEQFTRQPNGDWLLSEHRGIDASFAISSIDCSISLRAIYEDAVE